MRRSISRNVIRAIHLAILCALASGFGGIGHGAASALNSFAGDVLLSAISTSFAAEEPRLRQLEKSSRFKLHSHVAESEAGNLYRSAGESAGASGRNLWQSIRANFALQDLESQIVDNYERRYASQPQLLTRIFERAKFYLPYIYAETAARGMPSEIALLPFVESSFDPYAYSLANAVGLWQFIPSTGRKYGLEKDSWVEGRRDVVASTQAALDYLAELNEMFGGDWFLTLAAYNGGESRLRKAIRHNLSKRLPTDYQSLPLKKETRFYVPKLIAIKNIVADPAKHGVELEAIPNESYFTAVTFDFQVDLVSLAAHTNLSARDLSRLNPGYTRRSTPPGGPHRVLVPRDDAELLLASVNSLDPSALRPRKLEYTIKQGDVLSRIARMYDISVSALAAANSIKSVHRINVGDTILIPVATTGNYATAIRAGSAAGIGKYQHRVRKGETLWSIANKYNVRLTQLYRWNNMTTRSRPIRPNQVIYLYDE